MENETDEQFEERVLNKRAAQMFVAVRARMQKKDSLYLSEMTMRNNRKQVSFNFRFLLKKKIKFLILKREAKIKKCTNVLWIHLKFLRVYSAN